MNRLAAAVATALVFLAACGPSRAPERCRNLVQNPNWDNKAAGWNVGHFARLEDGAAGGMRSLVIEGAAEGPISQLIPAPKGLTGLAVVAVGYARVETAYVTGSADDDVTAQLWDGTVNLVNGYSKNGRDFPGPYTRMRFSGREAASGHWKRFVSVVIPARGTKFLYPHFAFWGARLKPGVKLRVAALSLVEARAEEGDAEGWAACAELPAPAPALESATLRQWAQGLEPNGAFGEAFSVSERRGELALAARYRQGSQVADRFVVAVTEDGSDPRLSATSRVVTVLARRGAEQWEATLPVSAPARPRAVAVAAAVATQHGLRVQTPLLPAPWQRP